MSEKLGMQMCRNGHPHPAGEPCAKCSPLYNQLVRQQVEIEKLKAENAQLRTALRETREALRDGDE